MTDRPTPTSDYCATCDAHLSEFCWVCHGRMEQQRDAAREEVERLRKEHNERTAFMRAEVDRLHRALAFARDTIHDVAHLGDADYLYDHLDKVSKGGKP